MHLLVMVVTVVHVDEASQHVDIMDDLHSGTIQISCAFLVIVSLFHSPSVGTGGPIV